ncbi:MAG TPA: DUF1987 domain-containing protein [Azospirillum sp.]
MERLTIAPTGRTPAIDFDFDGGLLRLGGESYPDDVATFFGPVFAALRGFLAEPGDAVRFDIELVYFNSSSAKALMNIFQMLEAAARDGRAITVNWRFEPGDDAMREFGEDFSEDLESVTFNLVEGGADGRA